MSIKPLPALQSAIAAAAAQGISASLLNMSQATLDGCGSHPGPIGHWEMALAAKAQISEALGWCGNSQPPPPVFYSLFILVQPSRY
jgi:hypothetical protein